MLSQKKYHLVDHDASDKSDILKIHQYLKDKNNII